MLNIIILVNVLLVSFSQCAPCHKNRTIGVGGFTAGGGVGGPTAGGVLQQTSQTFPSTNGQGTNGWLSGNMGGNLGGGNTGSKQVLDQSKVVSSSIVQNGNNNKALSIASSDQGYSREAMQKGAKFGNQNETLGRLSNLSQGGVTNGIRKTGDSLQQREKNVSSRISQNGVNNVGKANVSS